MSLKSRISIFLRDLLGIKDLTGQVQEMQKQQQESIERIEFLDKKINEMARALATLALVQASLVREIGDVLEKDSKPKTKSSVVRKPGTDFTN